MAYLVLLIIFFLCFISKKYGFDGLKENSLHIKFKGTTGQAFGAWLCNGVLFEVEGEANDYVGKGLSGGNIVVYPPKNADLLDKNFGPTSESIEVKLFSKDEILWDELAFPTVERTLKYYIEDSKNNDFIFREEDITLWK